MSKVHPIALAMHETLRAYPVGGEVAVNTQVLYPSNGVVTVFVSGGGTECMVSDRGAAARVVDAHGIRVPNIQRWLSGFAKTAGLKVTSNEIHSPMVSLESLPTTVMMVANVSAQAARFAVENYSSAPSRNLTEEIEDRLVYMFGKPHVARDVEMIGDSNRTYRFDFQVGGSGGSKIIIDHVGPFPSSINAKAVAHIDIGRRNDKRISQAIVYDPTLDWHAADIILLQSAAPTVPLEKMGDAIRRKVLN